MIHKTAKKIHKFKEIFFILIIVLFLAQLGLNPVSVGHFFGSKIGSAIGMSVGVPENPFNKLAAQLQEKEKQLALWEQELEEKEKQMALTGSNDYLVFMMGGGILVLFFLILANYYLDFKNRKKEKND